MFSALFRKVSPKSSASMSVALIEATSCGNVDRVLSLLNDGADVNAVTEDKKTVLMIAAEKGYVDIVRILLSKGADPNKETEYGWNALIYAAKGGYGNIVSALLDKGAKIDAVPTSGTSVECINRYAALLATDRSKVLKAISVEKGDINAVKRIVSAYKEADKYRQITLLPINILGNLEDICGHWVGLIFHPHKEFRSVATYIDPQGNSMHEWMSQIFEAESVPIQQELYVPQHDATSCGPLMLANMIEHINNIEPTILANSDLRAIELLVTKVMQQGGTALTHAAQHGHSEVAKILLDRGASVNVSTWCGWTPLMAATRGGYIDIVKALLRRGAFVSATDLYGNTAITVAEKNNDIEITRLLHSSSVKVNTEIAELLSHISPEERRYD